MLDEEKLEKETLLNSDKLLWKEIALQIVNTKGQINNWSRNSSRLTQISDAVPDRKLQFKESMIVEEDVTVLVSQLGWARMVKGHLSESAEIKYREGVGSNLELIDSNNSLKTAQNQYYNSLYESIIASIDIKKTLGTLLNN